MLVSLAIGCGSDDGPTEPVDDNKRPSISWTFDPVAVGGGSDNTLTVDVDDPDDGDVLTVEWEVTGGTFTSAQGNTSIDWTAPSAGQDVTVTATVSDGSLTASVDGIVKTGTVRVLNFTGTTTLSANGSPHILNPTGTSMTVVGSAILNISEGVEVFIKPDSDIQVEGELHAIGTSAEPIAIKPNTRFLEPGRWGGIIGRPNSSTPVIELVYTSVTHAQKAVFATNPTEVSLSFCDVKFSSLPAIHHQSSGPLLVEDCIITNNMKSGVQVDGLNLPQSVTVRRDSISFNGRFQDSVLYGEGEAGISITINDPNGLVPISIRNNEISRNDFVGIRLGDPNNAQTRPCFPVIKNNGIFGNELRQTNKTQIRLEEPFSGAISTIDATSNYWGQEFPNPGDEATIKAGIVDQEDDPIDIGVLVVVNPWLTEWLGIP